jgi:hypothetical protein
MVRMSQRWITVYNGPMWQVLALEGKLEAEGFTTFVPDRNIKTIDPFITGAGALTIDLMVPQDSAEAARTVLARHGGSEALPDEDAAAPEVELPKAEQLRRLGVRIRWCTLLLLTAPYGLYLAFYYVRAVKRLHIRPTTFALDVAAIVACALLTCVLIALSIFVTGNLPFVPW